jgi:DNA-directed RNA polymerase specialized sigma24 family protein
VIERRARHEAADHPEPVEPVVRAREELDAARERFEAAIRDASERGLSLRLIAAAADLSHQRVHQIIRRR